MWRSHFRFSCEKCGNHYTTREYLKRLMWRSHFYSLVKNVVNTTQQENTSIVLNPYRVHSYISLGYPDLKLGPQGCLYSYYFNSAKPLGYPDLKHDPSMLLNPQGTLYSFTDLKLYPSILLNPQGTPYSFTDLKV